MNNKKMKLLKEILKFWQEIVCIVSIGFFLIRGNSFTNNGWMGYFSRLLDVAFIYLPYWAILLEKSDFSNHLICTFEFKFRDCYLYGFTWYNK